MKILKIFSVIVFLISFIVNSSNSQLNNIGQECGTTDYSGGLTNIPVKTPGSDDFVRALVIYVTVPNDNTPKYALTIWEPPPQYPPTATRPINPYDETDGKLIFDFIEDPNKYFMERFPDYTISDYFCEMSMGQYDVIGDEVYLITQYDETHYNKNLGWSRPQMNRHILEYLHQTQTIEWERYDNWDKVGSQWVFGQQDGEPEMIMIVYRNLPDNYDPGSDNYEWFWPASWGGEASLAIAPITFGNVTINGDNGITAMNFRHNTTHSEIIMIHEYSHKLFGYQIPRGIHNGVHTNHGMMTPGHDKSTYVMSPWERCANVVDYTDYTYVYETPDVPYSLDDYVESGEVLKIVNHGATPCYYWVSNHQKISKFDGVLRGGKDCYQINFAEQDPYCEEGKGIIIEIEQAEDNCENFNWPYDIISAEGRYDWEEDREVYVPWQNYHFQFGSYATIYEEIIPGSINKRYTGWDEYQKGYVQLLTNDPCSDGFFIDFQARGDKEDAYRMGYDKIFSPYSNPSSKICDPNWNNYPITIALVDESNGVIDVMVYVDNDAQALSDLPPSKPKNFHVTKEYTPTEGFYPKLTWDDNIEPDFTNGGEYHILRGKTSNCYTEPSYYVLTYIVPAGVTEFIDYSVVLYEEESGGGGCQTNFVSYSYKITAVDNRSDESVRSDKGVVYGWEDPCAPEENIILNQGGTPTEFALKQNFPNPFNPTTNIQFDLPNDVNVSIKVYDITGKEVAVLINEFKKAGSYIVSFNGSKLSSGVYFYKIEAGSFKDIKRMVLVK